MKISTLREDLVATKEALNKALLDKEVLDGQNKEVGQYTVVYHHVSLSLDLYFFCSISKRIREAKTRDFVTSEKLGAPEP